MMTTIGKTRLPTLLALGLLAVNVAFLNWYLFVAYQEHFHSDSAIKVLLAREIVETGQYFPADWYYANDDLFVLFGHTFIIPLLQFLPAGYTVHALSGLISSILILSGVWFVTALGAVSVARRILIVAIVAAGISGFMAENLFGQVSYGPAVYFACSLLFVSWKSLAADRGRTWPWNLALIVILALVFWVNPQRAIIFFGLPLVAAVLLIAWRFIDLIPDRRRLWILLVSAGLGVAIGTFLHLDTLSSVNSVAGSGHARWLDYESMLRNLRLLPRGLLAIFGGLPSAGMPIVSAWGVFEALRLLATLLICILIPLAIARALHRRAIGQILLGGYLMFALFGILFLFLTTTIPDMDRPIASTRYLVPPLVLGMILAFMQPTDVRRSPWFGVSLLMCMGLFVSSALPSYSYSNLESAYRWNTERQQNFHFKLIEFLKANGLRYGYASYWHAGVLTTLSDEQILVRHITVNEGIPVPRRYLSSAEWYRAGAWNGPTFLLISDDDREEERAINWDYLALHGAIPDRELTFGNYRIYVFPQNIAGLIPGWDPRYEEPAAFIATPYSHSATGRFVERFDAGGGALVAEKGESGALFFGPYARVLPGRYRVTFDVRADPHPAGAIGLDVIGGPEHTLYQGKRLTFSDRPQELLFTLDEPRVMEFRVHALGNQRVIFRRVTIERLP